MGDFLLLFLILFPILASVWVIPLRRRDRRYRNWLIQIVPAVELAAALLLLLWSAAELELLSEPLEAAELELAVPPMQAVRDRLIVRARPAARSFFMFHFSFVNQFSGRFPFQTGSAPPEAVWRAGPQRSEAPGPAYTKTAPLSETTEPFWYPKISQMPRSGWLQLFQTSALHKEEAKKDVKKQALKKARHAAKEKSRGDQHVPILTHTADVHCGPLLPPDIPVFLWMYSI